MATAQLGGKIIKDGAMESCTVIPNSNSIFGPFETKLEIMPTTDMLEQKVEHKSGLLVAETYNALGKTWLDKQTCNHNMC